MQRLKFKKEIVLIISLLIIFLLNTHVNNQGYKSKVYVIIKSKQINLNDDKISIPKELYYFKDLIFTTCFTSKKFFTKAMNFKINQKVKLIAPLPYLKTSENMPMLRPPDLVAIDEIGEVISLKSPETVEVKFRRGNFLIDINKLKKVDN